ncbi:uncharacterized protein [Mytilus edulis]|uniref:uncharacterized protein n=1 Tax=Mytilus edulis TaxID=6550 RepID=UPI0039F10F1C
MKYKSTGERFAVDSDTGKSYMSCKFKMDSTDNAFEEFSSNTIGKLKDFLSARGLSCMGNKQQLVSRCFVAWESNIPLRYSEQEQQSKLKTEYANRLKEANIDDPRSLKDDDWSSDVKEWPKIDLGKIFSFILSKKEQDMDFIGHYKTQKAYSYYQSGFVDTVFCATLNGSQIIKSHVTPSQSIRNKPHDVWLAVNNENEIEVSWCSCIAGLAQTCNHVIAVLYKIEFATNMGYNDPSCTSVPCGWNTSTKKNDLQWTMQNLKKMNEIVKNKITKTTPLVAKVLGKTSNIDHVPAIKYGRAHENTARKVFLALESPKHRNFKVEHCGLFVKADRPYIAASPDGIVSCLCCTKQVLEIKCPFSLANKSVVDGWKNLRLLANE